jgi:hypothetical protein
MMVLIFLAAAVVVLVGGVGVAIGTQLGIIPEGLASSAPFLQSVSVSAGVTLALIGLALVSKKMKRLDRLVGGNSMSSRIRRSRVKTRAQAGSDDVEEAEDDSDEVEVQQPRRATPTPRAMIKDAGEGATREMSRSTGRISNRRKQAPSA